MTTPEQPPRETTPLTDALERYHTKILNRTRRLCNPYDDHPLLATMATDFENSRTPEHIIVRFLPPPSPYEIDQVRTAATLDAEQGIKLLDDLLRHEEFEERLREANPLTGIQARTQLDQLTTTERERQSLEAITLVTERLASYERENRLPLFAAAVGLAQVVIVEEGKLHHTYEESTRKIDQAQHDKNQRKRIRDLVLMFAFNKLDQNGHEAIKNQLITEKARMAT